MLGIENLHARLRAGCCFGLLLVADAMHALVASPTPTPQRYSGIFGYESDPGDFLGQGQRRVLTDADGAFVVAHDPGVVLINFDRGDLAWFLAFRAPGGGELVEGLYDRAADGAPPRRPWMTVAGEGRGCSETGWFRVLEAAYGKTGDVERLAIDFELRCDNQDPIFFGFVRIDSDVPPPAERTPTPTPRPDHFVLRFEISPIGVPITVTAENRSVRSEYYRYPWADLRPHLALATAQGRETEWQLIFASPVCGALTPGMFGGATIIPWEAASAPGMRIGYRYGTFCDNYDLQGRFMIREVHIGEDGEVYRFAADFEWRCNPSPWEPGSTQGRRLGSVSFTSVRPTPTPLPPTPTPSDYSNVAALYSEPGDSLGHCGWHYLTIAEGEFSAWRDPLNEGGVVIAFEGADFWTFRFAPPSGQPLVPGRYRDARSHTGPGIPGLDISGESRACNTYGDFTVLEAEYAENGDVQRFSADFEQHCGGPDIPPLRGSVRFRSNLPPPTPRPTYTPTAAPPCWGDCSGDREVTVGELLRGVSFLLSQEPPIGCSTLDRSGDGKVTVDELAGAVKASLSHCDPFLSVPFP